MLIEHLKRAVAKTGGTLLRRGVSARHHMQQRQFRASQKPSKAGQLVEISLQMASDVL
jgi:hypothetical protein